MKRIQLLFITLSIFLLLSCVSTGEVSQTQEVKEDPPVVIPEPEPEPEPVPEPEPEPVNEEYERATAEMGDTKVSLSEFEADKKRILEIIDELNEIMKNNDYRTWLTYLNPDSINYWSSKKNLATASKQLPVKGIQLRTMEDYFKWIFVPARKGRRIDEIRYESTSSIKAVQVKDDGTTTIYYNFKKIDGNWCVDLPTL